MKNWLAHGIKHQIAEILFKHSILCWAGTANTPISFSQLCIYHLLNFASELSQLQKYD